MQSKNHLLATGLTLTAAVLATTVMPARADAVTDWNGKAAELITEAKLGTPPAIRVMAVLQTAIADAAIATAQRPAGASPEAAIAAASRATLTRLMPTQLAAIDAAYQAALTPIADGPAKAAGITAGEKAAAEVLARRADDGATSPEAYRPHTSAGAYVPTAMPAVVQWPQRKPWLMGNAAQFRPAPPPALTSDTWAREYNEVKELGSKASTKRRAEQTEIARFWEYSLPAIYHGVVRSVALQPGRNLVRNARLYAAAAQAMDDAMIAVFDAKYHHNFWRPATAIRNGDIDNNAATQRDPSWASLIDAPVHPEFPSGHAILAGAVGAVVKAEVGDATMPVLSTSSPSAKGATRRWTRVEDFVQEVADSRIYAGIHYRAALDTGVAMGRQIGSLAAARHLQAPH